MCPESAFRSDLAILESWSSVVVDSSTLDSRMTTKLHDTVDNADEPAVSSIATTS